MDYPPKEWPLYRGGRYYNVVLLKRFIMLIGKAKLAYVASVSVRFWSKQQGIRVKDRAKNGGRARATKPKNLVPRSFFASETKWKRLLRRLQLNPRQVQFNLFSTATSGAEESGRCYIDRFYPPQTSFSFFYTVPLLVLRPSVCLFVYCAIF